MFRIFSSARMKELAIKLAIGVATSQREYLDLGLTCTSKVKGIPTADPTVVAVHVTVVVPASPAARSES